MQDIHQILKKYWGYHSFRPLQEAIIQAVLGGKDVLALLPTGGGKSICFQVPAMAKPGICLVVTPLIALMKDQVAALEKRGIAAAALFTGMSYAEIDRVLDNCVYGNTKFLYISPERLQTDIFQERVQQMRVNLLAVDEAHCISQWGYDFRPAYLEIVTLRTLLPHINVIALTATATRAVKEDIQEKLAFKNGTIFQKSFTRPNLAYIVKKTDDKERKLLNLLRRIQGTTIIYVSTRKKTKLIAQLLLQNHIQATFYHAGLDNTIRTERQNAWMKGNIRVMVATNAFGMGIDKPDVRLVIHMDLPASLEAYYQEAGRAGRDEQKSYAILFYDQQDIMDLRESIQREHPSAKQLKNIYQQLANYYQLAVGTQDNTTHELDWAAFAHTYRLQPQEAYQAIKSLANQGLIQLNEAFYEPAKLHIPITHQELYAFQVANSGYDSLIRALLRLYGGELFTDFCIIAEARLAKHLQIPIATVIQQLRQLQQRAIIDYFPQVDQPQVTFLQARYPADRIPIDEKTLQQKSKLATEKAEAVIHYITHPNRCRAQLLLEYFDEISDRLCGVCDICINKNKDNHLSAQTYQQIRATILHELQAGPSELCSLIDNIAFPEELVIATIRQMLDSGELQYNLAGKVVRIE
jgi:ATP-dependent DNA helicase RecQ